MTKRIDIYSILLQNGYRLPQHSMIMGRWEARADIYKFLKEGVDHNNYKDSFGKSALISQMASYSDEQWFKLVRRLCKNGHFNQ
jgi:hypothetical protein